MSDTLYQLQQVQTTGDNITADVFLNASHEIFQGHFPQHPVLPGVMLLEMLKDILRQTDAGACQLVKASSIKYMKLVDPNVNDKLTFEINASWKSGHLMVSASSFVAEGECNFKFKGQFTAINTHEL